MAKLTLNDVQNLENSETAKLTINNNNTLLETTVERVLFRDGTNPNHMTSDLDMNSNRILNLPAPIDPTEPLRLKDGGIIAGDAAALAAAVEAAEDAAQIATDQSALAKKWATNPEDVPVTTPPDEFSARHWAIKAQKASISTSLPIEFLTADKIWYVGLNGNDVTGDGTHDNPWYSVWRAQNYITTRVNCNGFAPVIQMFDGQYNILNDGQPGGYTGFTRPGYLSWDIFPDTPIVGTNVVAHGGALMELCEPLQGAQVTGGQPIRLCSAGAPNRSGDNCIIHTERFAPQTNHADEIGISLISVLHSGKLIIASMTFHSSLKCALITATQGGVIEVGANVRCSGARECLFHADNGGTIVSTGNIQLGASTGNYLAKATGGGSSVALLSPIDFQYIPGGYLQGQGSIAPHFGQHFVHADRQGEISIGGGCRSYRTPAPGEVIPPNTDTFGQSAMSVSTSKYFILRGSGLNGLATLAALPGGVILGNSTTSSTDTSTFAWTT